MLHVMMLCWKRALLLRIATCACQEYNCVSENYEVLSSLDAFQINLFLLLMLFLTLSAWTEVATSSRWQGKDVIHRSSQEKTVLCSADMVSLDKVSLDNKMVNSNGSIYCHSFIHLVDYLVMDSFHIIIRNSQTSLVEALNKFVTFTPSYELLNETDTSVILEEPRPSDAPQVRINQFNFSHLREDFCECPNRLFLLTLKLYDLLFMTE